MLEASVIGGVLGGLFRLAPEVLNIMDRKNERAHELRMAQQQLETVKVTGSQKLAEATVQAEQAMDVAAVGALTEAIKTQGQKTGIGWVDGVSATVRPFVTYLLTGCYLSVKLAVLFTNAETMQLAEAIKATWVDADMALYAGVLNFWFLTRVFEKYGSGRR